MRKLILITLVVLIQSATIQADICIRLKEHTDASYHHGTVEPAIDSETEIWIGNEKIIVLDQDRHLILDLPGKILTIIDIRDSSYVETGLPLDMTKIVPEEMLPRLAMFPTTGEISKLEETKKLNGRKCQGYLISSWVMYQGTRYREAERRTWVTTELPFDVIILDIFHDTIYKMRNYTGDYIEAMKILKGLEIASESIEYSEGQAKKSFTEIVGIKEKNPPDSIFMIPESYEKKEKLTMGN